MIEMPPGSEEATLLVPMHLDALVVNSTMRNMAITYNRWQMDYAQMNRFVNPMPDEFIGQVTEPPPAGVHLHWTLPGGLRNGVENEKGEVEFPFVPNRWLVVRIRPGHDQHSPAPAKAWVIISDAYGEDCTSWFMDPHASGPENIIPTRLGKKVALADWHPEPDKEGEPFLTAIAPGNVTFAAFAPGVENVFAFHDDLEQMEATRLAYLVVGWYSRPEKMDPLLYKLSPDAWQCKFLFNISSEFQQELDEGRISPLLGQVFANNGIELPEAPAVSNVQRGSEWRVGNADKDVSYTAKKENGGINVCESTLTVNDQLRWAAKLEGKAPPTRTLVHGLVYGVDWAPQGDLSKPVNVPDQKTIRRGVRIAVGNTSADALTALIGSQARNAGAEGQVPAELLEALQYDLLPTLEQVGSKTLLDQQIRQNWFGSDPGGVLWSIAAKDRGNNGAGQKPPRISPEQEAGLARLNRAQRELDAERRILASMQWELYALWWKSNRIKSEDPRRYGQPAPGSGAARPPTPMQGNSEARPPAEGGQAGEPQGLLGQIIQIILRLLASLSAKRSQDTKPAEDQAQTENQEIPLPQRLAGQLDPRDPRSFVSQVIAQHEKVDRLARDIPPAAGPEKDIEAYAREYLGLDPEKLQLKAGEMPRFWRPNDPVVLISGLGRPPEQDREGNLLCRLASQIIHEIPVLDQDPPVAVPAGDYRDLIPTLSHEGLPAGVNPLLTEAFLLDPGNAGIIAGYRPKSPLTQETLEKAIRGLEPAAPEGAIVVGRYGALEWTQPWSPLFLDWQVNYYYTFEQQDSSFRTDSAGDYIFAGESWHFDGTDAGWTGPEPSPQYRRSYSGRTFLTPHAPLTFVDRLRKYLESQPNVDLKANEAFLEKIANWDILSQTLSGFSDQLILRDLEYTVPPYGPIANQMADQHQGIPFTTLVPDPETRIPFFFPLRAGFLRFEALRIVDKFGRTVNLLDANNNHSGSAEGFLPIRGRGMISSRIRDKGLVELPPRVTQSSRMSFRFVSASDDRQETGLEAGSNPVCGWLLPNHIDKSISVYEAGGDLLGALYLTRKSRDEKAVTWQPAPGAPDVSPAGDQGEELGIANPHLKAMIAPLIHRDDNGAAFSNLLQVIDESLWTIDPSGQRDDQNLSVMIGRPLALVRANLQLELNGRPFFNQAWVETFVNGSTRLKENSGGLLNLDFPVRLGSQELRNDGLIGYFQGTGDRETDYTLFHAVHCPTSLTPANPPYIRQAGASDDYVRLKFKASAPIPFDPAGSTYLTMLVDPRGAIHASSGLLPAKVLELPERYIGEALDRMAIAFRAGPLLLEPETVRLPLTMQQHRTWTWIQAGGTKKGEWDIRPVAQADASARFSTSPLNLVEGWLKYSPSEEEPPGEEDK